MGKPTKRTLDLTISIELPEGKLTYEVLAKTFTAKAEQVAKMLLDLAKELSDG